MFVNVMKESKVRVRRRGPETSRKASLRRGYLN